MNKSSSWALVENGGRYLFIQRSDSTSRPGQWCPPGGGRRQHETPEEACVREVAEEVGLVVEVQRLIKQEGSFFYFLCRIAEEEPCVQLAPRECKAYRWILLDDLLELGVIMELKRVIAVLLALGVEIVLPDS